MNSAQVDPITTELVQGRLSAAVREMRTIMIRTAYSRMIIESHDFSSAILSAGGDLIGTSELEQPAHLAALAWSARAVLAKYGTDMGPGDLFLHNDPYAGGSHLNDVALFHPVFSQDRLQMIIGVMAHWQDIGGMVPGSLSGHASTIYQEGIRIPSLRVARRGGWSHEVLDLLFANVREPEDRRGDLLAMEGACLIAEQRLAAMIEQFGETAIVEAFRILLARAERRMRAAIGSLRPGEYAYEVYLDHSGERPEPLRLKLKLTVGASDMHADFTGSAEQVRAPLNLGPAPAMTAAFTVAKAMLDPHGPINAGAMRPLSVTAPPGTVVNARPPAACGAFGEVRRAMESLVAGALGMAMPERLIGDLKGASNVVSISGSQMDRAEDFLFSEFPAGGTGAFDLADGNNAMRNFVEGDLPSIFPIEAIELSFPLRVCGMWLRTDSGGPGERRGGLGLRRAIRVLAPHAQLSIISDRHVIPPYGVRCGFPGAPNRFTVERGGREIQASALPGKITGFPLVQGDVVVERTAGGGGYGNPLQRDPQAVARDVRFGYVSAEAARTAYGVVLAGGAPDRRATEVARALLNERRTRVRVEQRATGEQGARRTVQISPETAQQLHVEDGGLVEFPSPDGPGHFAWVEVSAGLAANVCCLGSSALSLAGVSEGALLELRAVHLVLA